MSTKTLYLIRHAESELNRDRLLVGGASPWCELNALGIAQSQSLGRRLAANPLAMPFTRVCCSTAVRTQQTMRYSLEQTDFPLSKVELYPELMEISQGDWEGKPRAEMISPEIAAILRERGWSYRPPNGESPEDVALRVVGFIERELLSDPQHEHIALFTHGVVIRAVWVKLLGLAPMKILEIPVENTSVSVLRFEDGRFSAGALNDVQHLRDDQIESLAGFLRPAKLAYPSATAADAADSD